ncbi:GNAT family N-acetyltransferase [Acidobacteria bacterium AH-259-A15]|nr:GNAT family N-acetyltransferase [Acidobacteria bacterium AH-259-A15]
MLYCAPMIADLRIEYLADHPELLPQIARWQYGEWGHLNPGDSIERRIRTLQGHLNRDCIPMTLVALLDSVAVGSASFVEHDLPDRKDLSPWLASVFVLPDHRRRGIGSALVRRVVDEAYRLKISPIFLFTWDQESLYRSLGWRVRERTRSGKSEIAIMEITPKEEIGLTPDGISTNFVEGAGTS